MEVKKSKKNVKFTTIAWVMAIMLLVIIIPLNIVVSLFDVQFDLTQNKMYSLTQTTRDYLSELEKSGTKVDMYLLCEMDDVREDSEVLALANMLDEIQKYDCINFKDVDPETTPEIKEELNPDGYLQLTKGDIVVRCGNNLKRIYGTSMYTYDYDENGNATAEYFNGENYITGAIKSVVEGKIPSVYFLTGHGEKSIENDYTTFRKNLKNYNYDAKELNLTTEEAVPDDAAIIIVAAPQTDISDAEKEKIEDFMDKGGNLSLLMSPNDKDFDYTNIEDIMAQYGIAMDYNIISETDSSRHVANDNKQIMVNLVDVSESEDKSISDLTSELIEQASSIIPYMPASRSFYELSTVENRTDLIICPLIETYDSAIGTPYGGTEVDPDEISGLLYLGAYSQDRARNDSKLVVMGNAEFIDDENVKDDYVIIPTMLYSRTITWMYNTDVDMQIPAKTQTSDYMALKSKEDTKAMMVILNAAPVIIAAAGLFVWLKRRNA